MKLVIAEKPSVAMSLSKVIGATKRLDGYIVKLDTSDISQMISLLRNATNNLNQVAKKANSTGSIYSADIADMQVKQDEIWETAKEILARLATIQ